MTLDIIFWHPFLVENDVKILWKCHEILMEFQRIFMRKRHPRKMPWECHEILMSFNGIENFGSFSWYFCGKSPWNRHGIWRHFQPKLWWESMTAFYYEGRLETHSGVLKLASQPRGCEANFSTPLIPRWIVEFKFPSISYVPFPLPFP